ncbi:MAG: metal-sulfur cluster assembly factor [Polyangiaceae bacterium]
MENELHARGPTRDELLDVLREVHDPELGLDIVALGLVRTWAFDAASGKADVEMTLTSAACPLGHAIQKTAEWRLRQLPGVRSATVRIVFEPPWSPDCMSDAAKAVLGVATDAAKG